MSRININANYSADGHYRYHMAPLAVSWRKSSKQRKTYVKNLEAVARDVRRSPELILQWMATPLGTTSGCDRTSGTAIYFLKGEYDAPALQSRMGDFCTKLVCCPKCGDCGTRLYVSTKGSKKRAQHSIHISCGACGHEGPTKDQGTKLARCVLSYEKPPKPHQGTRVARTESADEFQPPSTMSESESEEEEWFTDVSLEAVEARRAAAIGGMTTTGATLIKKGGPECTAPVSLNTPAEVEVQDSVTAVSQDRPRLLAQLLEQLGECKKKREVLPKAEAWAASLKSDATVAECLHVVEALPPSLAKHAGILVKSLYDNEVVTEDDITIWYDQVDHNSTFAQAAKAFLDFLQQY